jgi:hypothetical protein
MSQLLKTTESKVENLAVTPAVCSVIIERCAAILRGSSHYALRRLRCDFHEGVLSLRGVVPSYYLKQLAQALLGKLAAVEEINNQVVVQAPCKDQESL